MDIWENIALNGTQKKLLSLGQRNGKLCELEKNSPTWREWRQWRLENGLHVSFMDSRQKWTVPTEYPPANLDMALTALAPTKRKMLE